VASPEAGATDSIFVGQVGRVAINDAYRRLRNYRQLKGTEIYGNEVVYYVDALVESGPPGVADSLIAIAKEDREVRISLVAGAIELKSPKVGPWLEENASRLNGTGWMIITAAVQRAEWRDSTVIALLMEEALYGEDVSTRAPTVRAFNGIGTLSELRKIAVLADTTVSRSIEERALAALTRFDVPEFNRRVRSDLQSADELSSNIEHSIERHDRHDFLPELRDVASRLGSSMSAYDRNELQEIIAELERKKAQGAPLGVPLNWPETTQPETTQEDENSEDSDTGDNGT
jgi:hypothetical protein